MTENGTTDIEYGIVLRKIGEEVHVDPLSEDLKPRTLNDVYFLLSVALRDLNAQHQAVATAQIMMNTAQQMQAKMGGDTVSPGGIVLPGNKNIK